MRGYELAVLLRNPLVDVMFIPIGWLALLRPCGCVPGTCVQLCIPYCDQVVGAEEGCTKVDNSIQGFINIGE